MNIADSEVEELMAAANLGPLYQNQEEDPEVAAQMLMEGFDSDELPDLE